MLSGEDLEKLGTSRAKENEIAIKNIYTLLLKYGGKIIGCYKLNNNFIICIDYIQPYTCHQRYTYLILYN